MNKKSKYIQIFNYLKEFSKIRNRPIRDIEDSKTNYPERLWLNDIPKNAIFENVIEDSFDVESEYWLKLNKPTEVDKPKFNGLPLDLALWVEIPLVSKNNSKLKLKDKIEDNGAVTYLADNLNVKELFTEYVNEKWDKDWKSYSKKLEEYSTYISLHDTYKRVFTIYNKVKQYGEEYELVFGLGLLNLKLKGKEKSVFRHVLTQRAEINLNFSKNDSHISVSPILDFPIQVEMDAILDLPEQLDTQNVLDAEKLLKSLLQNNDIDALFHDGDISEILESFIQRISPDGSFSNSFEKPNNSKEDISLSLSPTLILRKRNTQSLTALYDNIIDNIESTPDDINIEPINELVIDDYQKEDISLIGDDGPIYFPKEYNDEQIQIVKKSRINNKVLVQGPPGTGKSHTIANLISHILADGKKVLVTAYTKRALEVLKEKLPVEFQNLAVNLLSGDTSSINDLQASVNSITDELSRANLDDYKNEIDKLSTDLNDIKNSIETNTNELVRIKEDSVNVHEINPRYVGSLTSIAEKIEKDSSDYCWYKDSFTNFENKELIGDVSKYWLLHKQFIEKNISKLKLEVPLSSELPSVEELREFNLNKNKLDQFEEVVKEGNTISSDDFSHLKGLLLQLKDIYVKRNEINSDFANQVISGCINGNLEYWESKSESSTEIIQRIESIDLKNIDRNIEITYDVNVSIKQLKNDAQILLNYLKSGSVLSGVTFKMKKSFLSSEIKEKLYFLESVRVNGSPCDTITEFETVLTDLELKQDLEEFNKIWSLDSNSKESLYSWFTNSRTFNNEIALLLSLIEDGIDLVREVTKNSNIELTLFSEIELHNLINIVEYNEILSSVNALGKLIEGAKVYLSSNQFHNIASKVLVDINNNDTQSYSDRLKELESLSIVRNEFRSYLDLKKQLSENLPKLIKSIDKNEINEVEILDLLSVIQYAHAIGDIKKFFDPNYEEKLINDLREFEKREKSTISKLASKKAWYSVVSGLQDNKSMKKHLIAWVEAVKKIGKTGKGKKALKFKKLAQKEMEYCKDAVPCWIMPLYKVAETIKPEQGMYDYVIIDEASQLGPDAIFLLYISKNIIIVGDDKQTSPEYVGINSDTMGPFIKKYLSGIPFFEYYGTEFSFFDHAKFFSEGTIALREHFRCMPEIIEFSNKHFYAPEGNGLYPLKQYSENRLEPLMTEFCEDAVAEGKASAINNLVEANSIVEKISEIVKDERYSNKTIGVIALQGTQQSSLIESLLLKKIGEQEYYNRKIVCGNSASFQGDERDVMFLSLVTAPDHNRASFTKPEDDRRFNVAVSRAIEQIWLFHSVQLDELANTNDLRYKLLDHFINYDNSQIILNKPIERIIGTQPVPFTSWFQVDVYNSIIAKGHSVISEYEVAKGKYLIDLVVILPDGSKIAIECDGDNWNGEKQYRIDLKKQKVLERSGWQILRIKGYQFYLDRDKTLAPLWKLLPKVEVKETIVEDVITNRDKFISISNKKSILVSDIEEEGSIQIKEEGDSYLLICYDNGFVNKVKLSSLQTSVGDVTDFYNNIEQVVIVSNDDALGVFFKEGYRNLFKAHLINDIQEFDKLLNSGTQVVYNNEFENLKYVVIPSSDVENIQKLIFPNLKVYGKSVKSKIYSEEFEVLNKL